jgi:2,3-bisphosphoglycerate-independent phosphoglycerate mutase
MKKIVSILVDGLADLPIKGKTPLAQANKPNLNWLSKRGCVGELKLVPKDLDVSSHIANASFLGYNPKKFYLRRGPLEAVGAGIPYEEGHLALRCNFATYENGIIIDRRAGRNTLGLNEIARSINRSVSLEVPFLFLRTYGHRAVLILKEKLSDKISSNDPLANGVKVKEVVALKKTEKAIKTAKLVRKFIAKAHEQINYHPKNAERIEKGLLPANYILVRGAGNRLEVLRPNFLKKWKLKNAICIAEPGVTKAIAMFAGFSSLTIPELSFKASLDFIFEHIENLLPEYDFILAHIKGPDEPAHDGNFKRKQKIIERIDEKLEIFKNFREILVLTSDHITSCEHKAHMHGPVPLLVYGRGKDKVKNFDEFSVKKGKLKNFNGRKLWKFVFGR